jgi:hypothetical protein
LLTTFLVDTIMKSPISKLSLLSAILAGAFSAGSAIAANLSRKSSVRSWQHSDARLAAAIAKRERRSVRNLLNQARGGYGGNGFWDHNARLLASK